MSIPANHKAPFESGCFYHVICKAIPNNVLFSNDENKRYFLHQFDKYILPFARLYCYCLLNNHAHFLIEVKAEAEIIGYLERCESISDTQQLFLLSPENQTGSLLEKQFNRFFSSYTRAFNTMFGRKGAMFTSPFRRINVANDWHFTQLVVYIHANVVKHNITADFTAYQWSSYGVITGMCVPIIPLEKEALIQWFGNIHQLVDIHREQSQYYYRNVYAGEE